MSLLGSAKKKKKKKGADPVEELGMEEAAAPAPAKAKAKKPAAARGVVVEKPKANIYTAMLVLSFVAILIGCICLYAEMNAYEFKMR